MTTSSIISSVIEFAFMVLLIVGFIYEHKVIAFEEKLARVFALIRREMRAKKKGRVSARRMEYEHRQRQEILDYRRSSSCRSSHNYSGSGVYRSTVNSSNSRVA